MQVSRVLPRIAWVLLVVSMLGFADAAYLTAKHYTGETPTCIIFSGCDVVTTSTYSTIGGIPIALLGALFYLGVFVLMLIFVDRRATMALKIVAVISLPAILFTSWLVYLQLFVLHALCFYCVTSAVFSTTICILSQFVWFKPKEIQ